MPASNMREIKSRMNSIEGIKKTSKAMKLISAAKLKKAKQQLEHTLPFFDKVKVTMADILIHSGNIENIFFERKSKDETKKVGYLIFTGDKGLAGGYNHNIIKLASEEIAKNPDALLFVSGQMGRNHFIRKKYNVNKDFDYPVQNPTVYRAREIAETIIDLYKNGEIDEFYVLYTKMISSIRLEPEKMKILPLDLNTLRQELGVNSNTNQRIDELLTYEPSPNVVLEVLVSKYIKGLLYGIFVEAFTSEQSARMIAMDNATSNAEEMIQKLNLFYNRARQATITQEISEIVGGAAALK